MAIVGFILPHNVAIHGLSQWTRNKQPTAVIATVTGATEGNVVLFYVRGSVRVAASTVDSAGEASAYNLDDGTYHAYEVGTGNGWEIEVTGASVVVTPLGGGSSAPPPTPLVVFG
jgi:hypothetical protein